MHNYIDECVKINLFAIHKATNDALAQMYNRHTQT